MRILFLAVYDYVSGVIERRRSRKVVAWKDCVIDIPAWRKQKAEEQFAKMLFDHHTAMLQIQIQAHAREYERQYAEAKKAIAKYASPK